MIGAYAFYVVLQHFKYENIKPLHPSPMIPPQALRYTL